MTQAATKQEVLIVGNPFSGMRGNTRRAGGLAEALAARGVPSRTVWDRQARRQLLGGPALADTCRCVVAAGGDGTVGDVINECNAVPLAMLPLGTENLLARYLGFGGPPGAAADAIARGRCRRLDLGQLSTSGPGALHARRFSLMMSAGPDAEVIQRLARWRSAGGRTRHIHRLSYAWPILGTMCQYAYPRIELEADGQRAAGASVMVFNLPCYGMNLGLRRDALPDDGLLDWIAFDCPGTPAALGYFWSVLRGRHLNRPDVRHGRARRVRLTSLMPVPVQADGDAAGFTPADIEVLPGAMTVIDAAK